MPVKQTHLPPWNYSMSVSHLCQAQSSLRSHSRCSVPHWGFSHGLQVLLRAEWGSTAQHSSPLCIPRAAQGSLTQQAGSVLLLRAHCQQPWSGSRKQPGTVCSELHLANALLWAEGDSAQRQQCCQGDSHHSRKGTQNDEYPILTF